MPQEEPKRGAAIGPVNWPQVVPFEPSAVSDRLGWVDLRAIRCRAAPTSEFTVPAITRRTLVLITRPPEELDLLYEGVKRHRPPPAGAVSLVPAGTPVPVALARAQGLVPHPSGAGAAGAGGGRGIRPRPSAADAPTARRRRPPAPPGRHFGGGRRAHRRRPRRAARRRVAGQPPGRPPAPARAGPSPARRAGVTARSPERGSAPSSNMSRNTLTPTRRWRRWPLSPASAPTTSRRSSGGPPGCRPTSTSSCAASNGPSKSCKPGATSPWRRSPHTLASRTRASFPITSSAYVGVTPGQFQTRVGIHEKA